jgi:hypothetical protein
MNDPLAYLANDTSILQDPVYFEINTLGTVTDLAFSVDP